MNRDRYSPFDLDAWGLIPDLINDVIRFSPFFSVREVYRNKKKIIILIYVLDFHLRPITQCVRARGITIWKQRVFMIDMAQHLETLQHCVAVIKLQSQIVCAWAAKSGFSVISSDFLMSLARALYLWNEMQIELCAIYKI